MCLLHWHADSYPLYYQGSPSSHILIDIDKLWKCKEARLGTRNVKGPSRSSTPDPPFSSQAVGLGAGCCCSVAQSCPTLCNPMDYSTQASLSFSISWSLLKLMSIESVMPSNHLVLCHPLLLLPSIFPSIRVFSSELCLSISWPEYWSFSISPSNEYSGSWLGMQSLGPHPRLRKPPAVPCTFYHGEVLL